MPYVIGLDFGSLSCRGVLVDVRDGHIAAAADAEYPHGILSEQLPDGTPLRANWCLQHPNDYLHVLDVILPQLCRNNDIPANEIVGLGVDFTASTVIPLDAHFTPMCFAYPARPHAWPKLWKHHAAQEQADKLTKICTERDQDYLDRYGGKISCESLLPKILQVYEEDPELFRETYCFVEAMDYVTSLLCGKAVFSRSVAAAKAMFRGETGYPGEDFFAALSPELKKLPREKLMARFEDYTLASPGQKVGSLCASMAERFGLPEGIAISAPQMDAYAAMPGIGIAKPGVMMLVVGTSTGIMLLSEERRNVEGVVACLPDTYYPGLWGYASGQASVGDTFGWFVDRCVPDDYTQAARSRGMNLHQYLSELAVALQPGESALLALDWLSGNRSCLGNPNLSGMILGLTLQTKPEQIYRSLLEATAFGARIIIEAYRKAGVPVGEIWICGGIANKNPLMMQIYADILNLPLHVSLCTQAPALGAAVYAAAAAGIGDVFRMAETMGDRRCRMYQPNPAHREVYDRLFAEYQTIHDYFGRCENTVMERLKSIARDAEEKK